MSNALLILKIAMLCLCLASTSFAEWDWMLPHPIGNNNRAAWGAEADDVFMVGDNGIIMRWNGTELVLVDSPTTVNLNAVWGSGSDNIFAVGDAGAIIHWNGSAWEVYSSGTSESLSSIWGTGAENAFAVGDNGVILRYDGTAWSCMESGVSGSLKGVWVSDPDNAYAVGVSGLMLHWDGSSWSPIYIPTGCTLTGIWGFDDQEIFVTGSNVILHWNGQTWSFGYIGYGEFKGIWGVSPTDMYAVSVYHVEHAGNFGEFWHWDGLIWKGDSNLPVVNGLWGLASDNIYALCDWAVMHWDGSSWTNLNNSFSTYYSAIWGTGPDDLFVTGHNEIIHYDGASWEMSYQFQHGDNYHWSIWGDAPNDAFALNNYSGEIIHWDGLSWTQMDTADISDVWSLWGVDANHVFAVGKGYYGGDRIAYYDGASWKQALSNDSGNGLNAAWGTGISNIFMVGDNGEILHFDGSTITEMASGTQSNLEAISGASNGEAYAIGWDYTDYVEISTILHWNGASWATMEKSSDDPLNDVWASAADDVYAVGGQEYPESEGVVLHWDGISWSSLPSVPPFNLQKIWGCGRDIYVLAHYTLFRWDGRYPLGVRISLPPAAHPGAEFRVRGYLDNPGEPLSNIAVFFVLEIHDGYWFWDDWTYFDASGGETDCVVRDIPTGTTPVEVVPPFIWPDTGDVSDADLFLYGVMIDPQTSSILGGMATVKWGYGPGNDPL